MRVSCLHRPVPCCVCLPCVFRRSWRRMRALDAQLTGRAAQWRPFARMTAHRRTNPLVALV
eukprot:10377768-Alexandrium_andersonii.AAC.1